MTLNMEISGSGATALLYLHYWGGSARTWRPVIDALPDDCTHVAVDLTPDGVGVMAEVRDQHRQGAGVQAGSLGVRADVGGVDVVQVHVRRKRTGCLPRHVTPLGWATPSAYPVRRRSKRLRRDAGPR